MYELQLREESITLKEIVPIVLACVVWGPAWANKSVTVHCDNEGAVAAIKFGIFSGSPKLCTCSGAYSLFGHFIKRHSGQCTSRVGRTI